MCTIYHKMLNDFFEHLVYITARFRFNNKFNVKFIKQC